MRHCLLTDRADSTYVLSVTIPYTILEPDPDLIIHRHG